MPFMAATNCWLTHLSLSSVFNFILQLNSFIPKQRLELESTGKSAVGGMKVSVSVTIYRNLKLSLNNIQATTWGWNESVTECFIQTQLPIFSLRKDRKILWKVFQGRHFYLKFKLITWVSGWSSEERWLTHHFSQNLGYLLVKRDVIKSIDFPRM